MEASSVFVEALLTPMMRERERAARPASVEGERVGEMEEKRKGEG
jgi:hypothetical protein